MSARHPGARSRWSPRLLLLGLLLAVSTVAARGPIELDAAAPPWSWCVAPEEQASEHPRIACTDVSVRLARCQRPDAGCGRLEHSRILLLAHQLRVPGRGGIARTIREGLEAEARDYDETDWLPKDPLYSLAAQIEVLAAPDAPWPDFLSDADRALLAAATGRHDRRALRAVFADTHEPALCRLLRTPATTHAMADAGFRTQLAGTIVRDLLATDDRRSTCAARLMVRHGHQMGSGARRRFANAVATLLPPEPKPEAANAARRWRPALASAIHAPGVSDDPSIAAALLRVARDQDVSPRLVLLPELPVRLGLMATPFPIIANTDAPLLEAPEDLAGESVAAAIERLVSDPGWPALARTLDPLALVEVLDSVAGTQIGNPARLRDGLMGNPRVSGDMALLLRLPALEDDSAVRDAIAASWSTRSPLMRTAAAAARPDHIPAADSIAAFRAALADEDPALRDAAAWNLLRHCGASLPRTTGQRIRMNTLLQSNRASLGACTTANALPEAVRRQWQSETEPAGAR